MRVKLSKAISEQDQIRSLVTATTSANDLKCPELEIRAATLADMELIVEFVKSSADWYRKIVDEKDMSEHDVGMEWIKRNFPKRDFYVASVEGNPLGTVSMQYFGDIAYLGYLYLDVQYIGLGFGQLLMSFAVDKAREKNRQGLALIGHPQAQWAHRAYRKFGFKVISNDKHTIFQWKNGILKSYYEEGFQLYYYSLQCQENTPLKYE